MCDREYCSNCPALEAEIRRLEQEIERLRRIIRKLLKLFQDIIDACEKIKTMMQEQYLSKKSGVARGRWAWAQGMFMMAHAAAQLAAKAKFIAQMAF